MKGFILLLSFMTRLYVPKVEYDEERLGKAMKYFPAAGLIISILLYITIIIFLRITYSINLAIVFVMLMEVVLTGGIHLDGLADTFDGIFSYRSKQKMLEIMKDSRIGTNGVLSLILYFISKFFLLQTIATNIGVEMLLFAIFSYPIVARLCSVVSCASAPYARTSGMGKAFVDNTNKISVIISFILTAVLLNLPIIIMSFRNMDILNSVFLAIFIIILILAFMSIVANLFSKLMMRKIGGITGDTLGALLELSQILYLLILLIIMLNFNY
ncbi:MAG: adenosylcobinamide-GDP ribazoletransferase [Fusobacterium gastrosuis]|uniref:adenosylcobinamide-GDP ribazoletransferase n=1 Tax=Fusobacterium TaxID=848 RepID=UPI0025C12058|nr:adenosylcobinamide-GDP ribazoletransferase [Fusobacterium sp.]MDD7391427.1 adenosylcobinamide-GDP ribazoletransferase [Fusobacteriaceae bacterium]MDY4011143.1 adenosylcobinamide-GDP ribazoletransferase [Fusobacterium gastrosuis]MCI5725685.1 adenosylcobinamide-GDP ribazoletransferase [Fusobacterium sp.]MCI7223959.1 adenosylcobinamide-GDP ribazoletransferase [Fusobacterium sp.]MDY5794642.1 adenosylcobinamide-GDP ribazoletransferase [Fusobacterium gastrosuis]